ncbi:MAG: serine/threonine-protein kinase [Candidatus Micrarchaeota archaeon]
MSSPRFQKTLGLKLADNVRPDPALHAKRMTMAIGSPPGAAQPAQAFMERRPLVDYTGNIFSDRGSTYLVGRLLGEGASGRVYQVDDYTSDVLPAEKNLALKVLTPGVHRTVKERSIREARILAEFDHPAILQCRGFFEHDDITFLVLDHLLGYPLSAILDGTVPLSTKLELMDKIVIAMVVAEALAEVHKKAIHRDLKPENIFLCSEDHKDPRILDAVKLIDFGIAKRLHGSEVDIVLTAMGETFGTPEYMSPEQLSAPQNVDHRSDLYSFGVVLYEMLANRLPFIGKRTDVMRGHLTETPKPIREFNPEVSEKLDSLVLRLLAKSKNERPNDAETVANELRSLFLDGELSTATTLRTQLSSLFMRWMK